MASLATPSQPSPAVGSKPPNIPAHNAQKPLSEMDIVLVFDASPGPERWVHLVWNYLRHLMEHLTARGQHASRIRLGVITYGRVASSGAMRRVSPIITQIPFSVPDVVMSVLKDQHNNLNIGIGTAASSGGMAVLEALVAAMEMCAMALPQATSKRLLAKRTNSSSTDVSQPVDLPKTFHVALFSHSEPNTTAKASFNHSQELDNLSWDALPDEFKRRRIHFHMVLMAPTPALALLHKRACLGTSGSAWFPMPSGHSFFVSGATLKTKVAPVTPVVSGADTNDGSPRKRPFSAVDTGTTAAAAPPQLTNTKSSPAGTIENTPVTSPNKRAKTTHESPRPPHANKPGPPFDTKQAAGVAQGAVGAHNSQQASVRTTEEHPARMQRVHQSQQLSQAQPSNLPNVPNKKTATVAGTTTASTKSPASAKPSLSVNASARGKPVLPGGNNGYQRQQSQTQNQNAATRNATPQGTPFSGTNNNANVTVAGPSNVLQNSSAKVAPNPANSTLNLSPAEILLTSSTMAQAAAQQMHLRRPGVISNGPPAPALLQALAQHAATTRGNQQAHQKLQQQRAPVAQGQGQPQAANMNPTTSKSPTTAFAQSRQSQSSPLQPVSQPQPPFPEQNPGTSAMHQQPQSQGISALNQQNNPHVSTTIPPITMMNQIHALQRRGLTNEQIMSLLKQQQQQQQAHVTAKQQQQQLAGNGGNPQVQAAIQAQMRSTQSHVQILNGRRIWAGAIKWQMLEHATKQKRTVEARLVATPMDGQETAAKLDLWPADFDLSAAGLSPIPPNALQEYIRSPTVPIVVISPIVENPPAGNDKKFYALWHLLSSRQVAATIEAPFAGMPSTRRGIVVFASPPGNSQKLIAAVYIDHDLPKFANARTSQQQQQHQQQQTQQSHQPQTAPALVPPTPRGPAAMGGPAQPPRYTQYIQRRMAHAAQLQQQAQGAGVNGLMQQQQANALGFLPGLPSAGVGAFGQGGGGTQPAFSANPEMAAQFQALRQPQQQHQQQRFGSNQQPPPGFLNLGGANGSTDAGNNGGAMTLDLLNTLLGAK